MLVGVISDSHDNMDNLRRAVTVFNRRGVSKVFHAGDFTSGFTFRVLKDLEAEFTGIFGNNDGDIYLLNKRSGGRIFKQPYEFVLDGKKAVMIHEHFLVKALTNSGLYDIVIFGHTHTVHNEKTGGTLALNPGELCGWLHGSSTAAVLDTDSLDTEIIRLD
ncbi:metallophosphoesterase [Candidatus Magnetomonas plexicatena]|uniref:metallophosphoesterase n=1 Tax=Candidatus Magnetomonas plexicatena TaxID=2552947 RepID=UPI001C787BE1|nr:metallophosphoesterase [Nitrospirales bacterium LBB_01]